MGKRLILNKKKRHHILLIMILLIIIYIIFKFINNKIMPKLLDYANLEIKKISSQIIIKSVTLESLQKLKTEDLFILTKNNDNEILTVDFNTPLINSVITDATLNLQENLKKLEHGVIDNNENKNNVVLKIPIGVITNNVLLNDKGPKIPVKLKIIGDMNSKIKTKITNYGINNSLIEVMLEIKIKEQVILPFRTNEIEVTSEIPIIIKITTGKVPSYYSGEINKSSNISIPIE